MSESATLTELETDSSAIAPEDLAAELARLDERIPALERDVEQLRTCYLALISTTSAAASAVRNAVASRADRGEIARLRADQLAADDELLASDSEKDAAVAALWSARQRRRAITIRLAELRHVEASAAMRELVAMPEPLLLAFVDEVLDPLLAQIHQAGEALNTAWWNEHEARNTPPAQRGQRPYTGEKASSALTDAITAITGFARGTTPRQITDRSMRFFVENLQSTFASLRDPRNQRAPNDPPIRPAQTLIL